ncbi:response regulator [candidate division KSB1 bacterium]|nr:response regulator [candidate division KSB1 bacterium]
MFLAGTRTIKQKIILGTAVSSILALFLAFVSLILYSNLTYKTQITRDYEILAMTLATLNRNAVATGNVSGLITTMKNVLQYKPDVTEACIYDSTGEILGEYHQSDTENFSFPITNYSAAVHFSSRWVDIFHPVFLPNKEELIGVQFIRVKRSAFENRIANYLTLFMIIIPVPVSLAIILALFLQRSMARPLAELGEAAKQISEKRDFSTRIKSIPQDEIGVLAKEFNDMLLEIEKYDNDQKNIVQHLEKRIKERVDDLQKESAQRKEAEKRERVLQKRLERSQRMESLGILAGGVAHDLNNILGPIVGYTDLMLSQSLDDSPLKGDIEAIHNAALRAAAVIQDLLTLARRGNYKLSTISVKDLINSYLHSPEFIEKQFKHENVTLQTDIAANTPGVKASDIHLRQVLMNLTINAMEAMPAGGSLIIRTKSCQVRDAKPVYTGTLPRGRYAQVEIVDTGEGIKSADAEHIFEPFYTKKQMGKSGTGLGLAIVYGIVSDLNGFIDLRSKPGEGTTFTLYFPATLTRKIQKSKLQDTPKGYERILVVDDDDGQRALSQKLLMHLGYEVFSINSGSKAIGVVRTNDFDLILMDMILDDSLDGLDTIQAILKYKPEQRFIIASGYSENERLDKAKKLVKARYLAKPYTLNGLGLAVRSVLDEKPEVAT